MTSHNPRRRLLGAAAAALLVGPGRAQAGRDWPTGWATPRLPAPAVALTDSLGRQQALQERLRGSATAVQLIFTSCGTTCPTQGMLFAHMAARHQARPVRWLSISIDALGDDAARLRLWQDRWGRPPAWLAAVPAVKDVDPLVSYLRGGPAGPDAHTTQVFGFDREGRLAYRTGDQPPVALLDQLVTALI